MKTGKGFTLVEVLVVVFVLFLLFFILTIIADHQREKARWIVCGSQLNGIGKAIAMYQWEYRDLNPVVWSENVVNGSFGMGLYNKAGGTEITRWVNPHFSDWDNQPTVGGCLFLLVKYEDVDPKMFICPKSPNDEIMELEYAIGIAAENGWVVELWEDLNDFQSMTNLSYSYNDPWKVLLDASAPASMVLMADKSNAYDTGPEYGIARPAISQFRIRTEAGMMTMGIIHGTATAEITAPSTRMYCLPIRMSRSFIRRRQVFLRIIFIPIGPVVLNLHRIKKVLDAGTRAMR